jgi:hypothetical protein
MASQILMMHPGGITKSAYSGWSWTCFFFGGFPPLFRGDIKYFIIFFVAHFFLFTLTFGIGNIIFAFVICAKYNEWHQQRLIKQGYSIYGPGLSESATIDKVSGVENISMQAFQDVEKRFFDYAEKIATSEKQTDIVAYCELQLSIADRYLTLEKSLGRSNPTRMISALSKKGVDAAMLDRDLLVRMAEFINLHPNLSESQVQRVRLAMQSLGLAE